MTASKKTRKSLCSLSGPDFVQFQTLCRICAVSSICLSQIHFLLLRETILEEIDCDLREQSIGQNVLILLLPLCAFFLELRQPASTVRILSRTEAAAEE